MINYRKTPTPELERYMSEQGDTFDANELVLSKYAIAALAALGLRDEPPHLLDYGCRHGVMQMHVRGLACYRGFEVNQEVIRLAHALGRDVGARLTRDGYDIVFARQVLQFSMELLATLHEMSSLVAPGGILFIAQSIPYDLSDPRHMNEVDSVHDICDLLRGAFPGGCIEHSWPVPWISPSETVIVARRPW